jgi:hypothetical protein
MLLGLVGGTLGFMMGVAVAGYILESVFMGSDVGDGCAPPRGLPPSKLFCLANGLDTAPLSPAALLDTNVGCGMISLSRELLFTLLLRRTPLLLSCCPTVILISVTMSPGLIADPVLGSS